MNELPDGVSAMPDPGGRDALRLDGPGGTVVVASTGAQLLSWRSPAGEVLWLATHAKFASGQPVRGGVPLVFPWFGDHADDKTLPAHGFARNLEWQLAGAEPGPTLRLACADSEATRRMWPHAFGLELAIEPAEELRVALTIENRDPAPFRCEFALHSYFAVGDVTSATVHGLESCAFTETASAPATNVDPAAPIDFVAETDRIYHGVPERIELRAPKLRRRVVLTTAGAHSAIVWNPWPEKTARLSQMDPDDWRRFCCIESACVKDGAIELAPGARHTLTLRVACSAL